MMVTHSGVNRTEAANEATDTRGVHARFIIWDELYKDHLQWAKEAEDDGMQADYHRTCALRCYLLFLVDTYIFVDKSATYIHVVNQSTSST